MWLLLAARAGQGAGIGLLIAGGLADVPRRMPPAVAGRVTGAMIAGTALGGLGGRLVGYTGNFLGWRAAFLSGGIARCWSSCSASERCPSPARRP